MLSRSIGEEHPSGAKARIDFWLSSYLLDATRPNRLWFHQFCERNRLNLNGLLRQPVEQFAAWRRGATVEAEGELVEIIVQMLGRHCALVCFHQPAFQQSNDAMHARQHVFFFWLFCLHVTQ